MKKLSERLDVMLVNKGLAESREKAKAYIMAGIVYVNEQKALKAGDKVKDGDMLEIRGSTLKYVSRGGLKLEKAIDVFNIDLNDRICVDVGASTGGFTDCMLQNGAKKVYCIDVGYGQLAWKLRTDERVVNIERTNVRYLDLELIKDKIDFSSIDVSFISLKLVLGVVYSFLSDDGKVVALIKPQFEAGREEVGKKGVVKDKQVHENVIRNCLNLAKEFGFGILGLDFSPIKGPEGNIEFLMYLSKKETDTFEINDEVIKQIVENAHSKEF
ncbi:MAG: TlyA family RNA methyltransferase [Ruminococcaceae bacterium]|nr:TlyA family RNA methyltransferase [Oscillospiraceae bacterium]